MEKLAILAMLEAKPGREKDVEAFLVSALPAQALFARAEELFAASPAIEQPKILAAKSGVAPRPGAST